MGRIAQQETQEEIAATLATEQMRPVTEDVQLFLADLLVRWSQEQWRLTVQQEDARSAYEGMLTNVQGILRSLALLAVEKPADYEKEMVAYLHARLKHIQVNATQNGWMQPSREYFATEKSLIADLIAGINQFI